MPKTLRTFVDPDNPCRVYRPGDPYPGPDYAPAPARLQRLQADGWVAPDESEPAPEAKPRRKPKK